MPEEVVVRLLNYGVLGIMVIGMAWYIKYLHSLWKEDRNSLKEVTIGSTEAIKMNTNVLSGLKTLLESLERRIK